MEAVAGDRRIPVALDFGAVSHFGGGASERRPRIDDRRDACPTIPRPSLQRSVHTSIIIATHERPASLRRLLHSLAPQFLAGRHELFLAENGTAEPRRTDASGIP